VVQRGARVRKPYLGACLVRLRLLRGGVEDADRPVLVQVRLLLELQLLDALLGVGLALREERRDQRRAQRL